MTQRRVSPISVTSLLPATPTLLVQAASGQSSDIVQIQNSSGTNLAVFTSAGVLLEQQPTATAINASATLSVANLLSRIITTTSATAVTLTLSTGTVMDAGFTSIATGQSINWSVINLGSSSGAITMAGAATGHTYTGNTTIAISTSASFRTVRTGAATWVTYRLT